jgi:uncharacterized protein (TIRG00374 family)
VVLLALVATRIDFGNVHGRLSGTSWALLAAAAVALFASFLIGGGRWHSYLAAAGVDISVGAAIRAYLIGTFTTNFLPSQVGGDVARAWIAGSRGTRLRSTTTVVVDRATALLCLICIGWIGVAALPGPVPSQVLVALGTASIMFGVVASTALLISYSRRIQRRLRGRFRDIAGDISHAVRACVQPPVLTRTLLVGFLFQGLVVLAAWLVARSISLQIPFAVIVASLAPVLILSAAPVSIGGFGVREGSYVVLLGYAGVGAADATFFSLLAAAAFALASLPGALALVRRIPAPDASPGTPSLPAETT